MQIKSENNANQIRKIMQIKSKKHSKSNPKNDANQIRKTMQIKFEKEWKSNPKKKCKSKAKSNANQV